jgi:hypothetical protein
MPKAKPAKNPDAELIALAQECAGGERKNPYATLKQHYRRDIAVFLPGMNRAPAALFKIEVEPRGRSPASSLLRKTAMGPALG